MPLPKTAINNNTYDIRLGAVCEQSLSGIDNAVFLPYPGIVTVHNLMPYVQEASGMWQRRRGERIGLYHPLLANIAFLGEPEWLVYDMACEGKSLSTTDVEGFVPNGREALKNLLSAGLLINRDKPWNVRISPQFDEADLYIKTTEGCNFSCKGFVTASDVIEPSAARTMDIDTMQMLLERFVVSGIEKNMKLVNFKWAGGEPLLKNAFRVIAGCQDFVRDLRKRYPQIAITQSLLTNGVYASPEKIDLLRDNDILVNVSLWGTPDYQDKMRLPRNRMESFHRIISNLKYMHESGMYYSTSFVVTPENAHDYADFISMIWDMEHPDFIAREWPNPRPMEFNIGIYRPQHGQVYNPGDIEAMVGGLRKGFDRIRDMIERGIPIPYMDRFDYLDMFNTVVVPCGSGYNYVAVGPEGANACHEGLFGMKPNIDRIRAGENMFDVVNEEFKPVRNLLTGNNIQFEREGSVLSLHGGQGCPRLAKSENDGQLGKASEMALIYADIYEDILSLEAMRRMKTMGVFQ